jgi:hypothetical protein
VISENRNPSTLHTDFRRHAGVRVRDQLHIGPPPELLIDDCEESDDALTAAIPLLRVADEYLATPVGSDAAIAKLDELLALVRRNRVELASW